MERVANRRAFIERVFFSLYLCVCAAPLTLSATQSRFFGLFFIVIH